MSQVRRRLLWFTGGSTLLALLVLPLGCGSLSQFSPVTFEHRGVQTWDVPYTGVRVVSIPGQPRRVRIVQFWIDEGYLKPEPGPTERWDVITGEGFGRQWSHSGSSKSFWYGCLCGNDESAEEWIAWSRRHPDLAADLWPRVVGLLQKAADLQCQSNCYFVGGALMQSVQWVEDATTYHERVAEWRKQFADEIAAAR